MRLFQRLRSEWLYLSGALRALRMTTPVAKNKTRVFPHVVAELAEKHGARTALISDRETFTYAALNARANRYARWAQAHGVAKGDVVALLMPNRPEYPAIWIGVTRMGGVMALLNTNLTGAALAHCINIVSPKHILVAAELLPAFETARASLTGEATLWVHGENATTAPRLDLAVEAYADAPIPEGELPALTTADKALYIYTSGTTGLPKAANINHYRIMAITHGFSGAMNVQPADRMYICLPMYHTVGGVLALGATLLGGGSVVIRERFSAREFWDDILRFECTLFQYIGELCRYLVHTAECPAEKQHRVRLCCGNGLRPDVWRDFAKRFKIPNILEFYAATEGNVALFNFDSYEGAVGRIPKWAERRFVVKVVRFDVKREEPVRGADGFCEECAPGEVGEVIGEVLDDPMKPANRFEGYAEEAATERKLLRNVFKPGDVWFRTGDLMKKDAWGYFFFSDRIGDTFRWKGENVSTSEVSEAISTFPGIEEANVYGVHVPRRDGRAGMAALVTEGVLDLAALRAHLEAHLPDYARPLFLRFQREICTTGTFKQKKIDLVRQGFDPSIISDELWFNNAETRRFERIDPELYTRIVEGKVRL